MDIFYGNTVYSCSDEDAEKNNFKLFMLLYSPAEVEAPETNKCAEDDNVRYLIYIGNTDSGFIRKCVAGQA